MTELPKGWVLTTVGETMSVAYGKSLEQGLRADDGEYRYVGSGGPIAATDERLTFGETIVVGRKGTAGSVQRFPQGCWPSDTTFFIEVPDGLNAALIEHQLRSAQLVQHDRSTALPGLGRPDLEATSLMIPPLAEQERIVTAIEEAFSKLGAGEAGLRTVRQLLKRMRDAILTAAVTGRLVPQDPTDTPAAKLLADLGVEAAEPDGVPELPPSWAWTELGVIAEVVGGVTKDSKRQSDASFVEVPYLRVANVQRGFLDLETITTIRVAPEKAAQLELQRGDVLFNEGGDRDKLGRGWVWEGQIASCIHQNHVFRARLSGGVEPKLVSIWGNTFGRGWFEDRGKQTTNLASLNLKTLKAFPVPIAPVEEQSRILAEVERQMSFLDACERAVDVGLARAAGLRRSVLKAAFEGRLVPQDPSDEPATVLLERIRAERSMRPAAKRRARQTA
jgi:type I restriction enzyme S subunit